MDEAEPTMGEDEPTTGEKNNKKRSFGFRNATFIRTDG